MLDKLAGFISATFPVSVFVCNATSSVFLLAAIMCCNCNSGKATLWCTTCKTNYCSPCYQQVHSPPALKTHVSIAVDQKPVVFNECVEHPPEELKFWCNKDTCKKLICRDCIILQHEGHSRTRMIDAVQERTKEVRIEFYFRNSIKRYLYNLVTRMFYKNQINFGWRNGTSDETHSSR
jgi:hypothetical protein